MRMQKQYAIRTPGTNEFTICGEYGELKTDAQNLTRSLKRYESSKNKVYRK